MVYYFTSNSTNPPVTLFMGKDKYENEHLIKHAWDCDIWFHTCKLSSAHIYIRLENCSFTWETLPNALIEDAVQLTKANSIQASKMNNVAVIYTPASNLLKNGSMDIGQVMFVDEKRIKRVNVEKKLNGVLNRLRKTRVEEERDLFKEKVEYEKRERRKVQQKLKCDYDKSKKVEKVQVEGYGGEATQTNKLEIGFADYEDSFM